MRNVRSTKDRHVTRPVSLQPNPISRPHGVDVGSRMSSNNNNYSNRSREAARGGRGVALPPLLFRGPDSFNANLSLATQELRCTLMRQTGGDRAASVLSHTDLASAMDTLLDTRNMSAAGDTWKLSQAQRGVSLDGGVAHADDATVRFGELVVGETPWYQPPLKTALLRERCCYPDDTRLFQRPNLKEFSVASNYSAASSALASERNGAPAHGNPTSRARDTMAAPMGAGVGAEERRRRHLRAQRVFNALSRWCDVVIRVSEKERKDCDPGELHEKCMMVVHKEEEMTLLVLQLQRYQTTQELQRRRGARQQKEREEGAFDAMQRQEAQHKWRSLLTSWVTEGTESEGEASGGAERVHAVAASPPSAVARIAGAPPTRQMSAHLPLLCAAPSAGASTCNDTCSNVSGSNALQELQQLVMMVADRSTATTSHVNSEGSSTSSPALHKSTCMQKNPLLTPQSCFVRRGHWVKCVFRGDDLPGIKRLTQHLSELTGSIDLFRRPLSSGSRQKEQPKQDAANSGGGGRTVTLVEPPLKLRTPLLLPLRLYFRSFTTRVRVVVTDALALAVTRRGLRQRGSACSCSDITERGSRAFSVVESAASWESGVASLNLQERLSVAGDVMGEPPRSHETLIGYSVDMRSILEQSQWRALTIKRLANEETVEVQRCILAKVVVELAIYAVLASHEQNERVTVPSDVNVDKTTSTTATGTATVTAKKTPPSLPLVGDVPHSSSSTTHLTDQLLRQKQQQQQQQQQQVRLQPPRRHDTVAVAPLQRDHYVVDTRQMYLVAASALEETNETLLPSLRRLRMEYRQLVNELMRTEDYYSKFPHEAPSAFTTANGERAAAQVSDALQLLQLEATYSELLATLHHNECAIIHYNQHIEPYCEFLRAEKQLWAPLYLRTLRLAHAFCVLVMELGTLPIPLQYRPFLGPVLQLVGCYGGQKEMRLRIGECLLKLEERAKRVRMPLLLEDVPAHCRAELDAAAAAVAEGWCTATRIITCLAVPEDVLATPPTPLAMPQALFVEVPSIAG